MEEIRVWEMKQNYMYSKDDKDNCIYFKSIKEHLDIAYLDLRSNILYINSEYKRNFKQAKRDIKKDFKITLESEYLDVRW